MSASDALKSHIDRVGGETRPQQERMVEIVSDLFQKPEGTAIVQAGTGTGKSLAYLFPAIASGSKTVVATATNQLSEQLYKHDIPEVAETFEELNGKSLSYTILKGRNNYICLAKTAEIKSLDESAPSLFDGEESDNDYYGTPSSKIQQAREDAKLVGELIEWADTTDTGDRSDAIAVTDRVWKQVSVSSAECPGANNCPFGEVCFTEIARRKAKSADLVITNHALIAQEAAKRDNIFNEEESQKSSIFGDYANLVIDEAHDLPDSLTSALTSEINTKEISKLLGKTKQYVLLSEGNSTNLITDTLDAVEILNEELEEIPAGKIALLPDSTLVALRTLANSLMVIHSILSKESAKAAKTSNSDKSIAIDILSNNLLEIVRLLADAMLDDNSKVKWVERRNDSTQTCILRIAPLEVGNEYQTLAEEKRVLLTSATLTVGNSFEALKQSLGLTKSTEVVAEDVGSPFDYPRQGMLYIPKSPFPEPIGKDRTAHIEAVLEELYTLVKSSGGRALALFTTTSSAKQAAEYLRERIDMVNIYAHGEAPADTLVNLFKEDETSILCATMGLWQGTNVPGPSCSLVVIDKVGFAPIDDVLSNARRELANSRGRDGFKEIVVAQAATSLAQAVGRLIRTSSDKGVVAILDPRIHTKQYGRTLLSSLPDFKLFTDRDIVQGALERLTGGIQNVPEKPKTTLGAKPATHTTKNLEKKPNTQGKPKLVRSSYKRNIGKSKK